MSLDEKIVVDTSKYTVIVQLVIREENKRVKNLACLMVELNTSLQRLAFSIKNQFHLASHQNESLNMRTKGNEIIVNTSSCSV